ncbi:DsbA family oxidoreductase (plasmid) [Cupriavidus sp. KK10]|uniref:DsbA family oxidoreductase n=1 Tax=Cupriavidus sp. KK10 TaxID=1478019 RepID=UPI001BAB1D85|nr:DsbA family oxidoreductase [Cupriavidus sp. KK10]QUN32889.1 DsbA family oxidoreductase [Cupriavidus sp. KK10]
MKRLNVEVWSDFVCPWCWIEKRRLEKAAKALPGTVEVVVSQKSYRLARGLVPEDFSSALYKKFGNRIAADGMMDAVTQMGAIESLVYNFGTMRFGDTTDAHMLVKLADPAEQRRLIERIFSAATTEGLDIFDRSVLSGIAKDVETGGQINFDDSRIVAEIAHDEMAANRVANGVPLFVLNGRSYLLGAREVAVFERALLQAAIDAPEGLADIGAICDSEGCKI